MTENLKELLETSIELELLISDMYSLYGDLFSDDAEFWWKLSLEEKNHASLLESGRLYLDRGVLPADAVFEDLGTLIETKERIQNLITQYKKNSPAFEDAYYEAVKIESSAAEFHFQVLLASHSDSKVIQIFQELGGADRDHAQRVSDLLTQKVTA
jgi:hypothetical protein